MIFYFYILVFIISLIVLGISSGIVARSFIKLSRVLGMNEYIISFVVMGAITSIPEIFIAIASIITNTPLISIGNILGANFANITLVLGIVALVSGGIEISGQISKRIFWLSLFLSLLPSVLIFNGGINRSGGIFLCLIFLIYLILFSSDGKFFERSLSHIPYRPEYFGEAYLSLTNLIFGIPILILSSIFITIFGLSLANSLSVDLLFTGVVFLGLLTSLPELFFGLRGAILRHPSLSLGNILAAIVFNGTFIIGMVAIVSQTTIRASGDLFKLNVIFMLVAFLFLSIFSYISSRISRLEGILLILIYLLFITSALFL